VSIQQFLLLLPERNGMKRALLAKDIAPLLTKAINKQIVRTYGRK
jgi:hypothetical protein